MSSNFEVLHITWARTPVRYVLHDQVLEAVDHVKYLGLEISRDLNWYTHIQNLTTKANRKKVNRKVQEEPQAEVAANP